MIKIIIPVLNEKQNLTKLIKGIEATLCGKYQIILVDDGSTDGTLQAARRMAKTKPILIYERKKTRRGSERGAALQFGLIKSLETPGDVFVEMDGDLSHQPEDLLPALDILQKGEADMVIGSKYHSLSQISGRHWSRQLISVFASFITGMVIDSHIRDWSNGLRAYNRSVALRISRLCSLYRGPSFLPESLAAILNEGFRVEELPSYYKNRQEGKSKLSIGNVIKALFAVFEIGVRYHLTGFKFNENEAKSPAIVSGKPFQRRKISFFEKLFFAGLCAVLSIQLFFLPDHITVDPLGLANPIFQYIKTGMMSYPIHGYDKVMLVHPPFYYWIVAMLVKNNLPLKFAVGIPAFFAFIILLKTLSNSPFLKFYEKILPPFCIVGAIFIMGPSAGDLRPDLTAFVLLTSGSLILAVASREQWNIQKVFVGTIIFSIGANLHYVYLPALLGLIPIIFILLKDKNTNKLLPQISMASAVLLVAFFATVFFYIPNAREIFAFLKSFPAWGGLEAAWTIHKSIYLSTESALHPYDPATWIVKKYLALGIPILLILAPFIFCFRKKDFVLPIITLGPFIIFLFATTRKHAWYYLIDWFFCLYLLGLLLIPMADKNKNPKILFFKNIFSASLLLWFFVAFIKNYSSKIDLKNTFTAMEIVRSDIKKIIGEKKILAGSIGDWFISGGDAFYEVVPDLSWKKETDFNVPEFLGKFDYVICSQHMSNFSLEKNGQTISSLIAKKILVPKVFVFFEKSPFANFVLCENFSKSMRNKLNNIVVLEYDKNWTASKRQTEIEGPDQIIGLVKNNDESEFKNPSHQKNLKKPIKKEKTYSTTILLNEKFHEGYLCFSVTERPKSSISKSFFSSPLSKPVPFSQLTKPFKSQTNLDCLPRYSLSPKNNF